MSEPRKPQEIINEYTNKCAVFGDKMHKLEQLRREVDALERDLMAYHDELETAHKYWGKSEE
jgi:hypothetical protein